MIKINTKNNLKDQPTPIITSAMSHNTNLSIGNNNNINNNMI